MSLRVILFFAAFLNSIIIFSQKQNFNKNLNSENVLNELAKSGKYDLISDFFVVQKKPLIRYAKVFKLYKGWGYINTSGKEVIETKYRFLTDFYQGICKATFTAPRKHPETGRFYDAKLEALMNIEGKMNTNNDYHTISFFKNYSSKNIYNDPYLQILVHTGNKQGLINKDGREIIAPEFDEILDLKKSFAVKDGKKWAIVNVKKSKLTDFKYDGFKIHKNFIFSEENGGLYLINTETGTHLSEEKFNNDYNLWDYDNNEMGGKDIDVLIMRKGKSYVLINKNGKKVIEAQYLRKSSDEYYAINYDYNKNSHFGLIDSNGKLVLDTIYTRVGTTGRAEIEPNFYGEIAYKI